MSDKRECTCDPRYRSAAHGGGVPEDPCGHGDTSEGCPVHDPNYEPDEPDVLCEWFALCDHPATHYREHPVLGPVPTCDRCERMVTAS